MFAMNAAEVARGGNYLEFPAPIRPQAEPTYSPWEPVFANTFERMAPQFVWQFLRSPDEPFIPLAVGKMYRVWHRPSWLGGLLKVLARHGILVSTQGTNVPMKLAMLPRSTTDGHPYNVCARTFEFAKPARWDTLKTWDPKLCRIVEYIGHHRRLMVVQKTVYDGDRTLTFETERIAVRAAGRRLWLPRWFWRATMGTMRFRQVANSDGRTIDVRLTLTHSLLGEFFGYAGTFEIVRSDDPRRGARR
jgi:hypothetical protein